MKYIYGLAILCCLVLWSSCRNDFETVASSGNLEFSKDTVYLDTIFTNIGSSTYNLKVYNNSKDDIHIPSLGLAQGESSHYRLNVDGVPGKVFKDVQILAKDSIFIFVETTFDISNPPVASNEFLYTDQIVFDSGSKEQKVELVTLVKDAVFLYPERFEDGTTETLTLGSGEDTIEIPGFFLDDNELTFTNEKPYVIYGFAAVKRNKTLTVEAGARVHFHYNSGIMVAGSIKVMGEESMDRDAMENEVIFQGDRLEPFFKDVPGQWAYIRLTDGSTGNEFHHTTIKNAQIGLVVENSPVTFKDVEIYNNSNIGLLSRTGTIYGENMVINNSGQASLLIQLGGSYEFNHCTFVNYSKTGFRNFPSVMISNALEVEDGNLIADLNKADFTNCIIYGSERFEFSLGKIEGAQFNFNFKNSLLRFEDTRGEFTNNPLYDFLNPVRYTDIVLNAQPYFQNTDLNNFNIEKETSGAENIGIYLTNPPSILKDLNGVNRSNPPDAGAYESSVFPED
ncbi:hypothetical protein EI546_02705 [Aequorivita sp. H23M31]|uniref:Right-handed parallel beta-helix repeat-containing protein n=1 Tax=Aequorivita ciconiae TaxID=2494375 RepID=A0A410G0E1_9FLAO|nr:hypothetical protein [Aequorivita sp. H23M31]QAA80703.1 hypothetical protein EI546_02705 [Aequorivita sp. H23M31]